MSLAASTQKSSDIKHASSNEVPLYIYCVSACAPALWANLLPFQVYLLYRLQPKSIRTLCCLAQLAAKQRNHTCMRCSTVCTGLLRHLALAGKRVLPTCCIPLKAYLIVQCEADPAICMAAARPHWCTHGSRGNEGRHKSYIVMAQCGPHAQLHWVQQPTSTLTACVDGRHTMLGQLLNTTQPAHAAAVALRGTHAACCCALRGIHSASWTRAAGLA